MHAVVLPIAARDLCHIMDSPLFKQLETITFSCKNFSDKRFRHYAPPLVVGSERVRGMNRTIGGRTSP